MKKELPKRPVMEFNLEMDDIEQFNLAALSMYLETGYQFHEGDLNYFCYLCKKNENILDDKLSEFYNTKCFEDNKLREQSRLTFYQAKLYHGESLLNGELDDMADIFQKNLSASIDRVIQTVKDSGQNNLKKAFTEHEEEIRTIYKEARKFEIRTLLVGNKPVYWNKERMLHIITRHIKETFIKYHNKPNERPKTIIPYSLAELQSLIQRVLETIDNDVQEFLKSDKEDFFKKGIDYNNDKYRVRIKKNGLLMMFTRE